MNKVKMQISNRIKEIPEALSVHINNIVYKMKNDGERIKTLSLGEAFFNIPFYGFDEIDVNKGYHYSESLGTPELRKKISSYYKKNYDSDINPNNEILISTGSKPIIFMVLQTILNPEDEVLIHEPAWLSYPEQIKLANGVPVSIPYDCPTSDFKKYINEKTKALILNNPNNPAGKVYSKEELKELYTYFREKGIYIIVDEAYSDFIESDNFTSMINIVPDKDGIIVVNSLSKNLGISGWRVGYVISTPEIIYNVLKLNQHLITCPSTILLLYLEKYFDKLVENTLPQAKSVTNKRNNIEKYIRSIGLKTLGGSSTFYIFINLDNYKYSSLDFTLYLLFKYKIAVVPGLSYGKSTERFIRIGVGAETEADLKESIQIIKKVIDNQEYDKKLVDEYLSKLEINKFKI